MVELSVVGTLPGRQGPHEGETLAARGPCPGRTRAKPWLREGEALVTRGRSPGYTRAKPWLREGEALVTRGRSPGLRGPVRIIVSKTLTYVIPAGC
jgi:hypothetical protein